MLPKHLSATQEEVLSNTILLLLMFIYRCVVVFCRQVTFTFREKTTTTENLIQSSLLWIYIIRLLYPLGVEQPQQRGKNRNPSTVPLFHKVTLSFRGKTTIQGCRFHKLHPGTFWKRFKESLSMLVTLSFRDSATIIESYAGNYFKPTLYLTI